MSNFNFLKKYDKNLYEIISDAEKLYRDEYFEQCITQTRRFGENICKNVLGEKRTTEKSFDDMLATLKDNALHSKQEKEFIDDLYFLKKEGNASVHSTKVQNNAIIALECLQRSFEIAINYAVYNQKGNSTILKLKYDTELLITGEKTKQSLAEKYKIEKNKYLKEKKKVKKTVQNTNKLKTYNSNKNLPFFKYFLTIISFISAVLVLSIYLLSLT